jgi:polysaccharide biosynthesis transport protein
MMDGNDGFPVRPEVEGGSGGFLTHVPAILWQRKWLLIIPALLGTLGAIAALLLIPSTYKSSAVMLVQSPQLGADVTGEVGAELIDRRIARYREQITARPELVSLIEKHSLYTSERKSKPLSKIVDQMRKSISVTPTQSDIVSARPEDRTIAFELDFEYSEPVATQAVAQQLMERVLELDQTGKSEQSINTVQFLSDQAKSLEEQITGIQGQISAITARNGGVLSQRNGVTMLGSDGGIDGQIMSLQREISQLSQRKLEVGTSGDRDPVVASAETQLAAAQAMYTDGHPDVISAKQRLAEARKLAASNVRKLPVGSIDQEIGAIRSQIAALESSKARMRSDMASAMNRGATAPLVEQQIADLQGKMSGLNDQYKVVSGRLLAARAGVRAEDQQMGERLTTVEPPVVPDSPSWPNRWLILGLGVLGGLGLGTVMALLVEMMLSPIRDPARLASIMGMQPIGVIPMITAKLPNVEPAKWFEFWKRSKR